MEVKERKTTYISVPPPPLPEFYKKQHRRAKKSSSSSTPFVEVEEETVKFKETVKAVDGTYDGKPSFVPPTPMGTIPPRPGSNDVPPLAIYHICRVCLRPRSARYHREHPIPLNGVPPPPGICRRCRFTSLEDTKKVAEVVMQRESAPVKIGCITPFVPDKDIISNEEMRRMKVEKYLRGRTDDCGTGHRRSDSRKDVVFRHVKVVDEASTEESGAEEAVEEAIEELMLPRKKKVVFTSRDLVDSSSKAPNFEPPTAHKTATTSVQVQPTQNPPSLSSSSTSLTCEKLRKLDSKRASVLARATSMSRSESPSTVQTLAKASMYCPPGHTESEIRKFAKDEIEQYAKKALEPEQRHQEIRRLAREEVERYRQAEREMEAHPDAYAHGRLLPVVPVERRIDAERDVAQTMPWTTAWKEESAAKVNSQTTSCTAAKDFAYEVAPQNPNDKARSVARDAAPKFAREVSVERYTRRDFDSRRLEPQRDSTAQASNPQSQSTGWDDEPKRSAALCEADNRIKEPDQPQSSTKPARYVVEVSTQYPDGKRTVRETVEEMDLPPRSRAASYRRYETDAQPPPPPRPDRVRELRSESKVSARQSTSYRALEQPADDKRSKTTRRTDPEYWNDEATARSTNTRMTRQSAVETGPAQAPSSRTPFPSPVVVGSTHASTHSRVTFQEDQASDKTRWSRRHRLAEEGLAGRSEPSNQLPYPEVDTMPDHSTEATQPTYDRGSRKQPSKPPSPKKDEDREYLYIERTVQPADRPRGSRPFDDCEPVEQIVEEETYVIRRRSHDESRRRRRTRGDTQRESENSNHVKFNKKVEISPTPPGSDASSSEFRSFHSIGPRGGRQIDGNDELVRQADIVGEYERRGRTRSRNSKTQYFHERETIYEGPDGVTTVKPKDRRKGGGKDRQAAWVSGSMPLERPLSESPSREDIIPPSRYSKSDGKGPYREQEKVTDSMHAEDGSPEKRPWRSIGEAAQVFW